MTCSAHPRPRSRRLHQKSRLRNQRQRRRRQNLSQRRAMTCSAAPAAEKAAPAQKPATPAEKPAEKPAGEEKKDEKKSDDIFGSSSSVLHEAGGLASNEMRQWVDNTGNFACQARLVRLVDGQVQLLKDNGHTTTVQLSRLSANDLRFVERQASAQHAPAFQTAQSTSEMPWMAN